MLKNIDIEYKETLENGRKKYMVVVEPGIKDLKVAALHEKEEPQIDSFYVEAILERDGNLYLTGLTYFNSEYEEIEIKPLSFLEKLQLQILIGYPVGRTLLAK